jgi:hypothetical protein
MKSERLGYRGGVFPKPLNLCLERPRLRTVAAILEPVSGTAAILDRSLRNLIAMEF